MGVILPDMFNPDGSLNEDALDERSRRIKARRAHMARLTGIPGVDALVRKHRRQLIKFWFAWFVRAAIVIGLVCLVVAYKQS